jgi:crotonobetainyl-CoA:carnitine CoA-transferase CaiB-like acyl-CoA transferase
VARPGSRVRLLEASSNRRPREMIAAPLTRGTEPGLQAFSGARCSIRTFHYARPVKTIDNVFSDPQVFRYRRPPPRLGEHTDEVLGTRLKLGDAELRELRKAGVI